MQIRFVVITHDAYTLISSHGVSGMRKRRMLLIALACVACGALMFMLDGSALRLVWFWMFMIGLFLLVYPLAVRYNRRRAEDVPKSVIYSFGDDAVCVRDGGEEVQLGYDAFSCANEDEDWFRLYPKDSQPYILPKADFTHGDPAEFAAFIAERTGLTVQSRRRRT